MALNKIISEGIKDSEVKLADMADDSVGVTELSATGTASSSTFLRGDNTWATPPDTDTTTPADNTVTAAKLDLSIVQGDIIYGTGTDTWARLAKGTADQSLKMNSGATAPEWGDAAAGAKGGGSDKVFWENGQTVTTDYTITDGQNAGTWGPITINNGVTVTIGDGEYWTIM